MNFRPLTDEDTVSIRRHWAMCAMLCPWTTAEIPIGDPCVMGAYAKRTVFGVYWKGEFLYKEAA